VKVLLHTCCAVCLNGPLGDLRSQGYETTAFFYNPNIHPLLEFRRRLKALRVYAESDSIEIIAVEDYGLREFLEKVNWRGSREQRCRDCYRLRLICTAQEAEKRGFDAFTTTLLISPMQGRECVLEAGREAAKATTVQFLEADWRECFAHSHEYAKKRSLYTQQYCGCIFSEKERFQDTGKFLYRGNSPG